MAEAMADVFDQLSQKLGDLRERNIDRSRLQEIREARAELDKAQQPAEPVAWADPNNPCDTITAEIKKRANEAFSARYSIRLYTHPPLPQQPGKLLTDEECEDIVHSYCEDEGGGDYWNGYADGMMEGFRHVRDNGYLAPAAGLTAEEAMEVLARYFFEVQQVAIGHKGSEIYDDLRARLTAAIQAKRTA